jgi:hypothetical protein
MRFQEHYYLTEKTLDVTQLNKYIGNDESKPKRGNIVIDKIENHTPFELVSGDKVNITVSKDDMKKLKQMAKDGNFKEISKIQFKDVKGKTYKITDFVKSDEFGGRTGTTATKPPPFNYEIAIVNAWNKSVGVDKRIPMQYEEIAKAGEEIVVKLKPMIKKKVEAVYTGPLKMSDVSKYWKLYADNPDKTPKTDILIDGYRISLKMGNAANLCSGKAIRGEGQALVFNALDKSKDVSDKLRNELQEWFKVDKSGKSKIGTGPEVVLHGREEFAINHKKMNETLNKIVESSQDFSLIFVSEAMTGERKFEEVSDAEHGIANYMLAASMDGSKVLLHPADNKEYVNKISKQVKIYVSWKTSGTGRTDASLWGGIKNLLGNKKEESTSYSIKSLIEYANSIGIDTEVLNEGIFDVFGKIWNTIVAIIKKGISYLLKFLGFGVEKVDIQGNDDVNFF